MKLPYLLTLIILNTQAIPPAAFAMYAVFNVLKTGKVINPDNKVNKDMIGGQCRYKGGYCNGAKVELFDSSKHKTHSTLISHDGYFKFTNLRQASYDLVFTYSKYKISQTKKTRPGNFISIELFQKPLSNLKSTLKVKSRKP